MAVPPRRPGSRRVLSEAEILDAALALIDAGGPETATIRRIAAVVGVPPGAVYTYFPEQAAVAHAVVDRLLGEVGSAVTTNGAWQQGVEALALDLRTRLVAHPRLVPLITTVPLTGPNALMLGDRLRGLIAGARLTDQDAARGLLLVKIYVLGAIVLRAGVEDFRWGLHRVLGGLSAGN